MRLPALLCALTLTAGCVAQASAPALQAEVGKPAPDFTLKDLNGQEHTLSDHRGKTVILEWFNPGCPFIVHTHAEDGSIRTLAQSTQAEGVVWLAINSGAPGKQGHGVEINAQAARDWEISYPILVDESGEVGKTYGAIATPHMYIIDGDGVLRYDGAIDNAPLGKVEGTFVNYVAKALDDLKAGREVATPRTKAYGCSVKYP